jgi:hypothetical protein
MRVARRNSRISYLEDRKNISEHYTSYHPSADHRTRIREKCAGENAVGIMA